MRMPLAGSVPQGVKPMARFECLAWETVTKQLLGPLECSAAIVISKLAVVILPFSQRGRCTKSLIAAGASSHDLMTIATDGQGWLV